MLQHMVYDLLIEIITAQVIVAVAGQNLHHALLQTHHRNVEGAPAQVVDQDILPTRMVALVGQRRGSWFVNDTFNI